MRLAVHQPQSSGILSSVFLTIHPCSRFLKFAKTEWALHERKHDFYSANTLLQFRTSIANELHGLNEVLFSG
jgi:hypothetical protein